MPRKLKGEEAPVVEAPVEKPTTEAAGDVVYKPWLGNRDDLEAPTLDRAGNVVKPGASLYYIERNKLIAVYRGGSGISRRLVAMLKPATPRHENDIATLEHNRRIKQFRQTLKKAGIQGA